MKFIILSLLAVASLTAFAGDTLTCTGNFMEDGARAEFRFTKAPASLVVTVNGAELVRLSGEDELSIEEALDPATDREVLTMGGYKPGSNSLVTLAIDPLTNTAIASIITLSEGAGFPGSTEELMSLPMRSGELSCEGQLAL